MGTFVIIIVIIAILIIIKLQMNINKAAKSIRYYTDYKGERNIKNPYYTISYNSCMGIELGDSTNFVVSRIKHLGYKEELKKYMDSLLALPNKGMGIDMLIGLGIIGIKYERNYINTIEFEFYAHKLRRIELNIDLPEGKRNIIKEDLICHFSKTLGVPEENNENNVLWKNTKNKKDTVRMYVTDEDISLVIM